MFLDENKRYELSNRLFWDTEPDNLEATKHKRYIIQRVLTRGTIEEFRSILDFYGKESVRGTVKEIRDLDNVTMHFCRDFFELPFEEMKCKILKQSQPQHWNY